LTAATNRQHLVGLVQLYGPTLHQPRPLPVILREIDAATAALATATRSWSTFLPRPAALDDVQSTIHGLNRLCAELRPHVDGGGNEAA
jgi:hypothetical protein